jgi:hypothetical protein
MYESEWSDDDDDDNGGHMMPVADVWSVDVEQRK